MADHDSFENGVVDGDSISDGWLNGAYNYTIALESNTNDGDVWCNFRNLENGSAKINWTTRADFLTDYFDADNALTKTGLSYDTTRRHYYKDDANAFVFESQIMPSTSTITEGICYVDYELFELIDECDNSSVDTLVWTTTTGTVSESSYLNVAATSTATTKDLSGEKGFVTIGRMAADASADTNTVITYVGLTDGTNTQALHTITSTYTGVPSISDFEIKVTICDWANKRVMVEKVVYDEVNKLESGPYLDTKTNRSTTLYTLTAWTSLRLYLSVSGGTVNSYLRCYGLRAFKNNPTTAVTISLAADGSTYETVTNGKKHTFSTTGTALKLKVTGTPSVSEVIAIKGYKIGITGVS
jgi:hypothetical protein